MMIRPTENTSQMGRAMLNTMGTIFDLVFWNKEIHSKDFCTRGRDQIFAEFGAEFENSAQYSADCRI